jgi:hypothetical protein
VNTRFTATYAYATAESASSTGGGSYLWSDRPAPPLSVPYTPNPAFQFNTTGQANTVTRLGTGYYDVRIEGFATVTGRMVVAVGGSAGTYCDLVGARAAATHFVQSIRCYGRDEEAIDSAFAFTFVESGNPLFGPVTWSATASIVCYDEFSNEFGGPRTCTVEDGALYGTSASWLSPGMYAVHLPTDMSAGNVQITPDSSAFVPGLGRCKITYWQWDTVFVQCFGLDGDPPDKGSRFGVSFVS